MSHLGFIFIVVLIGFIEHTRLSSALAGPMISSAFLAYVCIASGEKSVLIRAWCLGLAMDLWSPAGGAWYTLRFLLLAIFFIPLRSLVFQRSMSGWFIWAAVLHVIMAQLMAGDHALYADWSRIIFDACATGCFAIIIGAFLNELPPKLHPLGGPDVP